MKFISFVFVLYVLASANALRTASYSSALVSVTSIPDIEETSIKRATKFTQLRSRMTQNGTSASNTTSSNTTSSNTTSSNTSSNTTAPAPANSNSSNTNSSYVSPSAPMNATYSANGTIIAKNNTSNSYFNIACGLSFVFLALLI